MLHYLRILPILKGVGRLVERVDVVLFELFRNGELPLDVKEAFKLAQLPLEAHVGKNYWSLLGSK